MTEKNNCSAFNLFLISGIPVYLFILESYIRKTNIFGPGYFSKHTPSHLDVLSLFLCCLVIIYAVFFSYRGILDLQRTPNTRSVIFFVVMLLSFYFSLYAGIYFSSLEQTEIAVTNNDQAVPLFYSGQIDGFDNEFSAVETQLDKDDLEKLKTLHGNLALFYRQRGETGKAVEQYQAILQLTTPYSPEYYTTHGEISLLQENITQSILCFEKSLLLDSNNYNACVNLGMIYMGEYGEIHQNYRKALSYNKRAWILQPDTKSKQNLAINYFFLEDYKLSLKLLLEIEQDLAHNSLNKFYLGLIYYIQNDWETSRSYLLKAIELDPTLKNSDLEALLQMMDVASPLPNLPLVYKT